VPRLTPVRREAVRMPTPSQRAGGLFFLIPKKSTGRFVHQVRSGTGGTLDVFVDVGF
jgi:hypothetical protein